jgi:hypothetical protein
MKRRREQERDEDVAREQADARREALLAELKAHQVSAARAEEPPPSEPQLDESGPSEGDEPAAADEGGTAESETA